MASVWAALLVEAVAGFGVAGSLAIWARKRFTPREDASAVKALQS